MKVSIFWSLIAGFCVGVFVRSFVAFGWWTILFLACAGAMVLIVSIVGRGKKKSSIIAAVLLIAMAAGSARMHGATLEGNVALDAQIGEKVVIEGRVFAEPDARENATRLFMRVERIASTDIDHEAGVLVSAPFNAAVEYGDRIRAEGQLRVPESFESGAGRTFNYPAFLAKDGIGYELSFAQIEVIGKSSRNPLKVAAIWIKRTYVRGLSRALPEPEAGLAAGITAGDKRGLGEELSGVFREVGLIHVVVLSGYNIMVVISFIERIFGWTRMWVRSGLGVLVALLFAFMTGLASSSVRAASMAVIIMMGKTLHREYLAPRALALVAFLMLAWNPFVLAFDPGFQLSILATAGLIFISPLFSDRLKWITEKYGLREIVAATLGTQIIVLPLLVYQSGSFGIYALPTNLFALSIMPLAMLLSFIAGVFGLIAGPLAPLIGFPAYLLLWYIVSVAQFFAALPFASIMIPAFSFGALCAMYALMCVAFQFQKRAAKP